MQINQKNIFGDNVVVLQLIERLLSDQLKKDLVENLKKINIHNVVLHFEYGGEVFEFAEKIMNFLISVGFNVYPPVNRTQSGIKRGNYLEISKHPSDSTCAIIKIGSIF